MSVADAPDDPIGYYLEDVTYHGKSDRTRAYYERVLRDFESFLSRRGVGSPAGASRRDCLAYVHDMRADKSEATVATYASYLHRFYEYMREVGVFDENPMAIVVSEMDESITTDPARRDVSVDQMRRFVDRIRHPLDLAVVCTLLKCGLRVGECCNLDRRDLHLADVDAGPVRSAIEDRPDSLYVDDAPARGRVVAGERRSASNKRERATTIPIDGELARVLRRWLAVRPDPRSPGDPLFCSTRDDWGCRLTPAAVHHVVEGYARDEGWYRDGGGAAENVTPHYFRHFFTTHLRDRTGDRGVVKYLRGDVADDVIDTYTHDWGGRVREVYIENIFQIR